jgi:hypothetical protein
MPQHGGKRPGAGRPKGSKNKMTIAREAVAEVLDVDERQTLEAAVHKRGHSLLLEMERIAHDPTQPLVARITAARTVLPFLLPRRETLSNEGEFSRDLVRLMQEGRQRLIQRGTHLTIAAGVSD